MPQLFRRSANVISRATIGGGLLAVAGISGAWAALMHAPYATHQYVPVEQPVQFSHQHHVSGLGLDCRYCHTSVEKSAFAGLPPTETCMTCHSQVWTNSPMLQPVRDSLQTNTPLRWERVHNLGDFVYFNHSIHVQKGVACVTCHGRIDHMPLTWKAKVLSMAWCLDCHQHPARFVRPREAVFDMEWQPPRPQLELGRELVRAYHIKPSRELTDCYVCHR